MKRTFSFKAKFNKFYFVVFLIILIFQTNFQIVKALPMENNQTRQVIEELRLKVPSEFKEIWLIAEKKIWDPWLSRQDGFLGRQLFWDQEKEEALILVNWENKKLWKSISINDVKEVQKKFEEDVKNSLNITENPFKLIYEGELDKQG